MVRNWSGTGSPKRWQKEGSPAQFAAHAGKAAGTAKQRTSAHCSPEAVLRGRPHQKGARATRHRGDREDRGLAPGGAQRLALGNPGSSASTGWTRRGFAPRCTAFPGDLPDPVRGHSWPGVATHCGRSGAGRDEARDRDTGWVGGWWVRRRLRSLCAWNNPHHDHSPGPSLALNRQTARTTERTNFPAESPKFGHHAWDSRRGRPATPQPSTLPESCGAPGWREPPQPKNEWPAQDTRHRTPAPPLSPSTLRSRATCVRG